MINFYMSYLAVDLRNAMSSSEATQCLIQSRTIESPSSKAGERLLELVYDELRRIAATYLRRERSDHSLQPTELVHEAYFKLIDNNHAEWQDRAHFLAVAARAMRQVLVDHARRRSAIKRGGDLKRVSLHTSVHDLRVDGTIELLVLHDAIERLSSDDNRAARVAELRVFGGLTMQEVASVVGISERTAHDDWVFARAWLVRALKD